MKRKLTYDSDENESTNIEECTQGLKYDNKFFEPIHFLRCHSKANDPADVKTQVWQCAFEPDMNSPGHTTNLLATCGGNSVCLVDAVTGKVSKKFYSEEPSILLFSLAWTTLHPGHRRKCNILAVGGSKCYLQLILPSKNCSLLSPPQFLSPPYRNKAKDLISCMVFHPTMEGLLFCGGSSSSIAAWDISQCHPWSDSSEPKLPELLMSISAQSEVFSLSFSKNSNVLLAGCNSGLFGWSMNEVKWEKNVAPHQRKPKGIEFVLPEVSEGNGETGDDETLVDSVVCIPESSLVATKCALRGLIYLWNLADTMESLQIKSNKISETRKIKLSVTPVKCLRWSNTDNYFMAMGCSPDGQLLGCGDDEGGVWLYNIGKNIVEHKAKRVKRDADQTSMTEPHQRLLWPSTLADPEVQNARKVKRLEGHGGVIDHVTVGITQSGAIHLASVTSTNLVCIWKAFDDDEMDSDDKMLK